MQLVAFITLLLQSGQTVSQSLNVEDGGIVSCVAHVRAGGW